MTAPGKREDQMEEPRTTLYAKENIKLGWVNPPMQRSGMLNMGNTCYLNSSLQVSKTYELIWITQNMSILLL